MLRASGHVPRRPARRDADERLIRGSRPALDWTGDVGSQSTPDARSAPTTSDEPTAPLATSASLRTTEQKASTHPLAGRRRLMAIGAGVAALAIVVGVIALSRQPSKLPASACFTRACHQGLNRTVGSTRPPTAASHTVGARSHPSHRRRTARPSHSAAPTSSPTTSAPSRTPTPSPTSTPTPTSTPSRSPAKSPVHVSYSVVRQSGNGFQGQFTIVNNGSKTINGWEIAAVLPNDHIQAAWYAMHHTSGDTLYLDPTLLQQTIAPGGTLTENFTATGTTTTPTSCTFNGSPC